MARPDEVTQARQISASTLIAALTRAREACAADRPARAAWAALRLLAGVAILFREIVVGRFGAIDGARAIGATDDDAVGGAGVSNGVIEQQRPNSAALTWCADCRILKMKTRLPLPAAVAKLFAPSLKTPIPVVNLRAMLAIGLPGFAPRMTQTAIRSEFRSESMTRYIALIAAIALAFLSSVTLAQQGGPLNSRGMSEQVSPCDP